MSKKDSGSAVGGLIILAIVLIVAFIKWILTIAVFLGGLFLVVIGVLAYNQSKWLPQWAKKFSPNVIWGSGMVLTIFGTVFLTMLLEDDSAAQSPPSSKSVEEASSEAIPIEIADKFEADENGKVQINGRTAPNAQVKIYESNALENSITADSDGDFSFEVNVKPNTTSEFEVVSTKDGITSEKKITVIGPNVYVEPTVQLTVQTEIKTTKNTTSLEGTTEPGAKVTLKRGDKVLDSKKADSDGEFKFTLPTSKSGSFTLTSEKEGLNANTATIEVERVLSAAEKKARYKKSCKTISYKRLKKNPDQYAGERYKARGKILQIMEGLGQTEMRIAVTKDSWGYWNYDDVIYVTYDGTTDFVEDDVVTVYGEITGSFSYTSIAGWEITVPGVEAKYIEK